MEINGNRHLELSSRWRAVSQRDRRLKGRQFIRAPQDLSADLESLL